MLSSINHITVAGGHELKGSCKYPPKIIHLYSEEMVDPEGSNESDSKLACCNCPENYTKKQVFMKKKGRGEIMNNGSE